MRVLLEKFNVLVLQVGTWPVRSKIRAPASLWNGIAAVHDELNNLNDEIIKLGSAGISQGELKNTEAELSFDIESLRSDAIAGMTKIEEEVDCIKGDTYSELTTMYPSISKLSDALEISNKDAQINSAATTRAIKEIKDLIEQGESTDKYSVKYGRYSFNSVVEVGAWAETIFSGGPFPFGAFVDVYSVLQRVTSFKDVASSTELKNMEMLKKLDLSADAGLAIESFKHPLPKVFRGNSMETVTGKGWLPGIPTPERWEDRHGLSGARISIKTSLEEIRARLESLIAECLRANDEAQALARQMLSDTLTFITALCEFISETYRNLDLAGFSKVDGWQLVSKLVHRIFAKDCYMKRGAVSEVLDVSDSKVLGSVLLWSTFATHQVMRDYLKHGIENHPSMASEYVRFLVANSGLSKMQTMESRLKSLEEQNAQLKKEVSAADKAAKSAANKADEAKALAKKK